MSCSKVLDLTVREEPREGSRGGFVLICTFLLLGFLSILILGLTALMAQEMEASRRIEVELEARQAALLALRLGLGELMDALGPDARVTAPGALVAADGADSRSGWLGVWAYGESGEPRFVRWMVSGSQTNEHAGAFDEGVAMGLHELGGAEFAFQAPLVSYEGVRYAYHVQDASLSAQAKPPARAQGPIESSPGRERKQTFMPLAGGIPHWLDFSLHAAFDGARLVESLAVPEAYQLWRNAVVKVRDVRQLSFAAGGVGTSIPRQMPLRGLTVSSLGLLTRSDGVPGFKEDLSLAPELLGEGFRRWADFRANVISSGPSNPAFTDENDPRSLLRMQPHELLDPGIGDVLFSIAPVITDFGIQFSPRRETTGNVALNMRMGLELWNPYTQTLLPEPMVLEVYGVPDIEVIVVRMAEDPDTGDWIEVGEDPPFSVSPLGTFGADLERGRGIAVNLDFTVDPNSSDVPPGVFDTTYWSPGRVMYWVGPDNVPSTAADPAPGFALFGTKRANRARMELAAFPPAAFPGGVSPTRDRVRYRVPEAELTVVLRRASDDGVLARLGNLVWDAADSAPLGNISNWQSRFVTFQVRKFERSETIDGDPALWLKHHEPRGLIHGFGDYPEDGYTTISGSYSPDSSPGNLRLDSVDDVIGDTSSRTLFNRVLSSGNTIHRSALVDVPLFEIPDRPVFSLGDLQHLAIHGAQPFSIGNSWGGDWNRIFDAFYFSGQQLEDEADEMAGEPFSIFEVRRGEPGGPVRADQLMVAGRFNVNSTQASAWVAVLAQGVLRQWRLMAPEGDLWDEQEGREVSVVGTSPPLITRFPYSISHWAQRDPASFRRSDESPPTQFFQIGAQALVPRGDFSGDWGGDFDHFDSIVLQSVAEQIVAAVRERERPFMSLAEWINRAEDGVQSPLERAIAAVPELREQAVVLGPEWGVQAVDERVPGAALPSDFLSLLAPVLGVRGDTFIIRGYGQSGGDAWSPLSARAFCEAVVQRIADPADRIGPGGDTFRQFVIVGMRWLQGGWQ